MEGTFSGVPGWVSAGDDSQGSDYQITGGIGMSFVLIRMAGEVPTSRQTAMSWRIVFQLSKS